MAKIFYRQRNKVDAGDRQPRFAVVGVQGTDLTFLQYHLRKGELETIAQAVGAELIELPRGSGDHVGESGAGGGKKTKKRKSKGK